MVPEFQIPLMRDEMHPFDDNCSGETRLRNIEALGLLNLTEKKTIKSITADNIRMTALF